MRKFFLSLENWVEDESAFLELAKVLLLTCIGLAITLVPIFFAVNYWESRQTHIVLRKDEWQCVKDDTVLMPVMIGKVIYMMPEMVCTEYRMNGH